MSNLYNDSKNIYDDNKTDLYDAANVIDKLNIEFDILQDKNIFLEKELQKYTNREKAIELFETMINNGQFDNGDIPCYSPNRGVNCWKHYPIATFKTYDSANYMWDENGCGYDYEMPYEVAPPLDEIKKYGWEYIDTLDIACPHKGSILSGAFISPSGYSIDKQRIHIMKKYIPYLYEIKENDIFKYKMKQIEKIPSKLL